jgi:hypothetical protein
VWRKDRGALLRQIYEDIIVACGGVVPVVAVGVDAGVERC